MSLWAWMPTRRGVLRGARATVALDELASRSALGGRLESLRGRAVGIAARDPVLAALALVELDGVARRMVLCTPDLDRPVLDEVAARAGLDAWVVDGEATPGLDAIRVSAALTDLAAPADVAAARRASHATEWVLLTSGTSGQPKLVQHALESLAGGLPRGAQEAVWATFYDIRRYGGLQILLRALLGGTDLVVADPDESMAEFLDRGAASGVTHQTGTPTHWRRALMGGLANRIAPRYVRLSGEVADQALLDRLALAYPGAQVAHAFASTEAGVAFAVEDGQAGFPAAWLEAGGPVEMRRVDGTLRIRSARVASRYLGAGAPALRGPDGYVDTQDQIELRDGRCHFAGRVGGVINVGGLKVHPEEVEAVLNADVRVRMALVRARRNPIVGAIVVAEVVLDGALPADAEPLRRELVAACRAVLAPHKVPALLRFVPSLAVSAAGKLVRPLE